MQPRAGKHMLADPVRQGPEDSDALAAPVDQGRARDIGAHPGEDLTLPIERQMIVVLGNQDMGEQAGPGHAAAHRTGWRRPLHHGFAMPAGLFGANGLDDLEPGGDQFEDLGDVVADKAQFATALRAARAWIQGYPVAFEIGAELRLAAPARRNGIDPTGL
jgi:hypothetical protein